MKKKFFTIIVMLVMIMSMTVPVNAASIKAPGKVTLSSVKTASQSQIKITWKKVKGAKGYQVQRYQNGKWIEVKKLNMLTFTDSKLKAGTKYSYRVRAYKTYKQTQWYNKKTKKWVTKKPAKKLIGKSKKVTAYKYGKWSVVKVATTKKATTTQQTATNPTTVKPVHQHNFNIPIYGLAPDYESATIWECDHCDTYYLLYDSLSQEEIDNINNAKTEHVYSEYNAWEEANKDRLTSDDVDIRFAAQQEFKNIPLHICYPRKVSINHGNIKTVIGYKCSCGAKHYTRNDFIKEY